MSGIAPFSVLKSTSLTLNATQINALNSSPQILVPAAGANIVIIPLTFSACLNYVSTFTKGGKRITLRMGNNIFSANNPLWKTSIIDSVQTGNRLATGSVGWVGNYGAKSAYVNQPISIYAEEPYTDGAGSTIQFTCLYYELTC